MLAKIGLTSIKDRKNKTKIYTYEATLVPKTYETSQKSQVFIFVQSKSSFLIMKHLLDTNSLLLFVDLFYVLRSIVAKNACVRRC